MKILFGQEEFCGGVPDGLELLADFYMSSWTGGSQVGILNDPVWMKMPFHKSATIVHHLASHTLT